MVCLSDYQKCFTLIFFKPIINFKSEKNLKSNRKVTTIYLIELTEYFHLYANIPEYQLNSKYQKVYITFWILII